MPSESLTPDLTMSCIGWVQAGGAWALRMPSFHMCPKFACCPFVCRGLEACRPCSLTFYVGCFLFSRSSQELGFIWWWALYFFGPLLDFPHFLPYCSAIPAVMTQSCWASLGQLFILSPSGLVWPLVFPTYGFLCPFCLSLGYLWPTCFLWASLTFLLTLHSLGLLLTSLGFPSPITLFSSLGFVGLP